MRELQDKSERVRKRLRYSDFWSVRIGDYRVVYEIDRGKKWVVVLFVGHRRKVYDDFTKMFRCGGERVIVHYDKREKVVAVEITNITSL